MGVDCLRSEQRYSCILLDPPWNNKSVRRSSSYSTLPPSALLSLPIRQLLRDDIGLVAVWVTNSSRFQHFVKHELFDRWNVEYLATWFWVKITSSGHLVGPLESEHRKPFEPLILGRIKSKSVPPRVTSVVQDQQLIWSMPAQHSRKPPIHGIAFVPPPAPLESDIT